MDAAIQTAARLLAGGDPLHALKCVALRDDPEGLALRGVALAQLGDLPTARALLQKAAVKFGPDKPLAQARCIAAEGEIALRIRDLKYSRTALASAAETLHDHGDTENACYAQLQLIRWLILTGRIEEAGKSLEEYPKPLKMPLLVATYHLTLAELAIRQIRAQEAALALDTAERAALAIGIHPLVAEVRRTRGLLSETVACLLRQGASQPLTLSDVEKIRTQDLMLVDACRRELRYLDQRVSLVRRPVLFALLRELALAGSAGADRAELITHVFGSRRINESHRVRLRVEIGRLRKAMAGIGRIVATKDGFALHSSTDADIAVLQAPIEGDGGSILALLADGEAWSTSALVLALGCSQRSVQRLLADLEAANRVRSIGKGRSQRWLSPPLTSIATTLLLPNLQMDP